MGKNSIIPFIPKKDLMLIENEIKQTNWINTVAEKSCEQVAWVYPGCLARSKFRSARQSGGYGLFLSQEFAKM